MMRGLFASLRLRLCLLVCLALIPALGMMFYTASEHGQHTAREVQDQALRLAQLVSSDQERRIEGARHLLAVAARVPDVREGAATECQTFLSTLLEGNPLYANFGLADPTGEVICSALPLDEPVNVADRAYFLGVMEAHDFAIGEFQIGRVTHRATINFGYPILADDGRVQAVIVAAMDLSWLNHLVADAELPEGAVLMVIDRSGSILGGAEGDYLAVVAAADEVLDPSLGVHIGGVGEEDDLHEVDDSRGWSCQLSAVSSQLQKSEVVRASRSLIV